jgi:drug/metabolite transporter (DMT)-like permease
LNYISGRDCGGKKEHYIALLCMLLIVLFWGYSFISTKVVLAQIPPVSIAFLRQIIASSILIPLAWRAGALSGMTLKDLKTIALAGLFGIVLYFILENSGLKYTTASNASMIVSALPIFTLSSEALLFNLKVTRGMIFCLITSVAGVFMVATVGGSLDLGSSTLIGNLMVMGSMACWVIYTILTRDLAGKHSGMTISAYQSLASVFIFLPFLVPEIGLWSIRDLADISVLANLIFLGAFCSALAYLLYIRAVKNLGATVSSAFLNLIPVVTMVSGYLLLHERVTPLQILGMAMIMMALYLLNRL